MAGFTTFRTALGALVLFALLLRAGHALGRESLFCDEVIQFNLVRSAGSVSGILESLQRDSHPPLSHLLDLVGRQAGLTTPDALRLLPVLYGTLAVLLLGVIVRPRLGARAALIAAGLLAVSPYFIYFSGQLRSYSCFILLAVVHFGAALRFAERRDNGAAALWGLAAGALCLTHYYAAFHVVAAGLYLLLTERSRRNFGQIVLAACVCTLVFAPALPAFRIHISSNTVPWSTPQLEFGEAMLFARTAIGGGVLALLVWAWALLRGARAPTESRSTFQLAVVISMGGAWLAWVVQHNYGAYEDRYLGAFAAVALIPVGYAISLSFANATRGWLVLALVLVLQQTDARHWFRVPSPGAEAAAIVARYSRADDLVCVFDPFVRNVYDHHEQSPLPRLNACYPEPTPFVETPSLSELGESPARVEQAVVALRRQLQAGKRVWFLGNGWYPSDEKWTGRARPIHGQASPLERRCLPIHSRLLRTCYEHADPVFVWDAPVSEYWYPWTVLLFDPNAPER